MAALRRTVGALALLTVLVPSAAPADAAPADPKIAALWADLGSEDEAVAGRALLALAAVPRDKLEPFLQERVRPLKADPDRIAKLVKDLDSNDFATRQTAVQELEYLDRFSRAALEKHLQGKPSAEVKRVLTELVERFQTWAGDKPVLPPIAGKSISMRGGAGGTQIFIDDKPLEAFMTPAVAPKPNIQWVRTCRAVGLLEHLGTPAAKRLLQTMADGEADAPPTKAAKSALDRLGK